MVLGEMGGDAGDEDYGSRGTSWYSRAHSFM